MERQWVRETHRETENREREAERDPYTKKGRIKGHSLRKRDKRERFFFFLR